MTENEAFPPGWNAERVAGVIAFYDSQTEDEALAELEAAWAVEDATSKLLRVPNELVPAVQSLLDIYAAARRATEQASLAPV